MSLQLGKHETLFSKPPDLLDQNLHSVFYRDNFSERENKKHEMPKK